MRVLPALVLLIATCTAFPYDEFRLSDEELEEYFMSDEHRGMDHQVIYIEHVTNEGTRHVTRDMAADMSSSFKFRAFDEYLHVDVTEESADMFVDQTASCNVINAKGLVERTEVIPTSCFYHGNVRGHKDSVVTMSTCNGLTASVARLGHSDLYIEPLSDDHAKKRGVQNGHAHIAYKHVQSQPFDCVVEEDDAAETGPAAREREGVTVNAAAQRTVKIHVVADHQYYARRGADTCHCITAVFLAAARRLELLPNLRVLLNGVDIITSSSVLNSNLDSSHDLGVIKEWYKLQPQKDDWDLVALIVPYYMDVGGRAYSCAVCESYKVSVSYCYSMNGVQILAHEIGHNLCISHNDNTPGCTASGYTMGAASYQEIEQGWAQCSIDQFGRRIIDKDCLSDA